MLSLTAGVAAAQTLPSGTLEQLDRLIGSRVETFSVLDTQSGASGGTYASKLNDTDLAITRVTGRGDVAKKRPLGDSGVLWSPVLEGGIGARHAPVPGFFDGQRRCMVVDRRKAAEPMDWVLTDCRANPTAPLLLEALPEGPR